MHHVGVEPTSSFEHQGLSLTCLPISPMTQILKYTSKMYFTLATQDTLWNHVKHLFDWLKPK